MVVSGSVVVEGLSTISVMSVGCAVEDGCAVSVELVKVFAALLSFLTSLDVTVSAGLFIGVSCCWSRDVSGLRVLGGKLVIMMAAFTTYGIIGWNELGVVDGASIWENIH